MICAMSYYFINKIFQEFFKSFTLSDSTLGNLNCIFTYPDYVGNKITTFFMEFCGVAVKGIYDTFVTGRLAPKLQVETSS